MNVQNVIKQTIRRAGADLTRKRDTEEFERSAKDWRAVEKPERILNRMEQLGMRKEMVELASRMVKGESRNGFNPLERIIEESQLMSSFFLPLGAERTRAVGRIVTESGFGFGTGFLISPRLMMTNNHVLEDAGAAASSRIEFDFVRRFDRTIGLTQLFRLLPGEFFLTSVAVGDINLDYTIVAVEPANSLGAELAARGCIPLIVTSGKLVVRDLTNIIQHPGGDPQQVALRDSKVVESLEHFLRYEADTLPGSSGSPVFNDQWQLAALHHSGVPDEVRPGVYRLVGGGEWDTSVQLPREEQLRLAARIKWISNEGVRVSSIVADVQSRLRDDATRRALFQQAVREHVTPPEQVEAARTSAAAVVAATTTTTAAPQAAQVIARPGGQTTATWTVPLRITVELGPELQLSLSNGTHAPGDTARPPQPPPISTEPPSQPPQPTDPSDAVAAVGRARELLGERREVLEVRDGFLWQNGLMTERRAAVVVLDPNAPAAASGDVHKSLGIPREIGGVPVDVTLGGAAALLRAAERRGEVATKSMPLADLFQESIPKITYQKPVGQSLSEVTEPMDVVCHVSPDDGWPVLRDFLGRVKKTLTMGMFDLSAPHVVRELKTLAEGNPNFLFNLSIQRGLAGGRKSLSGEKKNDHHEEDVVNDLRGIMGTRFRQAYVDVSGTDRTFASSYHIKVAVRDGQEVWLSSGNLQSSNQPPPDVQPAADDEQTFGPLRRFNREWHVVIKNVKLARMFEAYLLHDLKTAENNPAELPPPTHELFVPEELPESSEAKFLEESAKPRYFARKVIPRDAGKPVAVQPLLTPDNFLDHVIPLVRSSKSTLYIQNQSLTLLEPMEDNDERFIELWTAIKERQDAGVDLKMIFRVHIDEDEARAIKDRLVKFGFKQGVIRVQKGCHTKGIIVDSKVVLVGSHNWTNQGAIANRDASLIFRHPEIARYYEEIFLFDWDMLAREPKPQNPGSGGGGGEGMLELALPGRTQPANTVRVSIRELLDD